MSASAAKRKRVDVDTAHPSRRHGRVDSQALVSGTPSSAKPQLTRACKSSHLCILDLVCILLTVRLMQAQSARSTKSSALYNPRADSATVA